MFKTCIFKTYIIFYFLLDMDINHIKNIATYQFKEKIRCEKDLEAKRKC